MKLVDQWKELGLSGSSPLDIQMNPVTFQKASLCEFHIYGGLIPTGNVWFRHNPFVLSI